MDMWDQMGFSTAQEFLNRVKQDFPNEYQQLILAVQDYTQEELDFIHEESNAIRQLQVAHFGDN